MMGGSWKCVCRLFYSERNYKSSFKKTLFKPLSVAADTSERVISP